MRTSTGFIQGYNVQAVVDEAHQVIVATRVSNKGTDMGQIPEMERLAMKNTGRKMKQLLVDKRGREDERYALVRGKCSGGWIHSSITREAPRARGIGPTRQNSKEPECVATNENCIHPV
ncbi:hypothetical protein [Sulfoacidibacillus ferrooxidans]|uniref:hypothetical protein n=1 Tax=Sulfoacidibacillus ferrooxidans TaxID=2005001 RepID=UPI001F5059F1|nr:hypothetical protein [Sulfoacidibacillus ferrooxidans]